MSENTKAKFHSTDKPSEEDQLKIKNHINGLSEFLVKCDTPMTISIQGEWGSGKSSIMKQIMKKTEANNKKEISSIWFDTWQFSQFSFDNQLPVILLERLVSKVSEDSSLEKKGKEQAQKILNDIMFIGKNITQAGKTGINAVTKANFNISIFGDREAEEESMEELYKKIEGLKSKFEKLVKESNKKFIIYIDDLDRLVPEKAVELLEVLKIFLDVDHCVFVLAIDYDVVLRGVADKYGFDMNNPEELEKGKNFFDKIIQVPYSVPLAEYNFEDIIEEFLEEEELNTDTETINEYEEIIINSIGKNPRSIKRIINMFKLNRLIESNDQTSDEKENLTKSLLLFTFTCMQNAYPSSYSYMINNEDSYKNNIANLVNKEINKEFLTRSELTDELNKLENERFLLKVEDIITKLEGKEDTLESAVNDSRTTFIDKQKKKSSLEVFTDLESLLEYYDQTLGKEINYTIEDIQLIENKINKLYKDLDKKIEKKYIANENLAAIEYRVDGSVIALLHIGQRAFSVECIVGNKLKDDENINQILENFELTLTKANKVTFNIMNLAILKNDTKTKDLMDFISIIIRNK